MDGCHYVEAILRLVVVLVGFFRTHGCFLRSIKAALGCNTLS